MENGQVVEQGSVFEIFASPKQPITKNFVDSTSNLSRIYELVQEKHPLTVLQKGQCILRLRYLKHVSYTHLLFSILNLCNAGDSFISTSTIYGGTRCV